MANTMLNKPNRRVQTARFPKPGALLVFLVFFVAAFASRIEAAERFAVVAGNNSGAGNERDLKWAESDARRVHELLIELGGVEPQDSVLLLDGDAEELLGSLSSMKRRIEAAAARGVQTELFFFFSGHGDAESLHVGGDRLTLSVLNRAILGTKAGTTLSIVDACRNGRVRDKGASHAAPFDIALTRQNAPMGHVFISSAGSGEVAQESDQLRSSFFSHHMIAGLRGAADGDRDGRVTLSEFYRYAYDSTLAASHRQIAAVQHPEMNLILKGEGELVITVLEEYSARLVLPEAMEGDFLIVDDRTSHVVVQVQKPRHRTVALALPCSRFRVQQRRGGEIRAGEIDLSWGGSATLGDDDLVRQRETVVAKKGAGLDPKPWRAGGAFVVGTPAALGDGPVFGGALRLERRFDKWFAAALFYLAEARGGNTVWRYRHLQTRFGLGLGRCFHLGLLRSWVAGSLGALVVFEFSQRLLPDLDAVEDEMTYRAAAAGGYGAVEIGIGLPLFFGLELYATGEVTAAALAIDDEFALRPAGFGVQTGLAWVF